MSQFKGIWVPLWILELDDIKPVEMLLLAEIENLAQSPKGCTAGNGHFAKRLKCEAPYVSKLISGLCEKGYLRRKMNYKKGSKQIEFRQLHPLPIGNTPFPNGNDPLPIGNTPFPIDLSKNKEENKEENKEREKRKRFRAPTIEQVEEFFTQRLPDPIVAKKEAAKFFNYYESNGWRVGRNKMKSWPHAAGGWISRMDEYTPKSKRDAQQKPANGYLMDHETLCETYAELVAEGYE